MYRLPCLALALTLAAACAPQEEEAQDGNETAGPAEQSSPTPDGRPAPDSFAETAWMARADDGARYVTQFDGDGTYRDLRNGDPWQTGQWSYADGPEGKQLCFNQGEDDGVERCWQPGRIKDGLMIATGPGGRRIELERVTYEAIPEEEGDAQE